jgi:hypothetical protein
MAAQDGHLWHHRDEDSKTIAAQTVALMMLEAETHEGSEDKRHVSADGEIFIKFHCFSNLFSLLGGLTVRSREDYVMESASSCVNLSLINFLPIKCNTKRSKKSA